MNQLKRKINNNSWAIGTDTEKQHLAPSYNKEKSMNSELKKNLDVNERFITNNGVYKDITNLCENDKEMIYALSDMEHSTPIDLSLAEATFDQYGYRKVYYDEPHVEEIFFLSDQHIQKLPIKENCWCINNVGRICVYDYLEKKAYPGMYFKEETFKLPCMLYFHNSILLNSSNIRINDQAVPVTDLRNILEPVMKYEPENYIDYYDEKIIGRHIPRSNNPRYSEYWQ